MDARGKILQQRAVGNEEGELKRWARSLPGPAQVVMEACSFWPAFQKNLCGEVEKMVLVHPARVKAIADANPGVISARVSLAKDEPVAERVLRVEVEFVAARNGCCSAHLWDYRIVRTEPRRLRSAHGHRAAKDAFDRDLLVEL